MIQTFIKRDNEVIEGVENEETIKIYEFEKYILGLTTVLITKQKTDSNGENYFNLYIIDKQFKQYPSNCLKEQIPCEEVKNIEKYFNRLFAEMEVLKHYLWFKYSTNEKVLSFNIEKYEY